MVILAGPNGAGKSTSAPYILRKTLKVSEFVNADAIASGLSGFAPESVAFEAGRILLRRIRDLINEGSSFAFETTLASKTLKNLILEALHAGYEVQLVYLALPSAEVAAKRVASRVLSGGHDIPRDVIHRRFHRSLVNLFSLYMPIVSRWQILDSYANFAKPIAQGTPKRKTILLKDKWQHLESLSRLP